MHYIVVSITDSTRPTMRKTRLKFRKQEFESVRFAFLQSIIGLDIRSARWSFNVADSIEFRDSESLDRDFNPVYIDGKKRAHRVVNALKKSDKQNGKPPVQYLTLEIED